MAFIKKKTDPQEEQRLNAKDAGPGSAMPRFAAPGAVSVVSPGRQRSSPSMQGGGQPMQNGGDFGRFVSLGEYLGQNQQQAQGMAGKLSNAGEAAGRSSQDQTNKLETTFNRNLQKSDKSIYGGYATSTPGESIEKANPSGYESASRAAQNASDYNKNLNTFGGVQDNLRSAYGAGGYSGDESKYDAALAGQAGGGRFAQLSSRYGNLGQSLMDANARSADAYAATIKRNKSWDDEQERRRKEAEDTALAAMANDQRKVGIDVPAASAPQSTPTPAQPASDDWFQNFLDSISPDKKKTYPSR